MKRKGLFVFAFLVVAAIVFATAAKAERRVALVIGNSIYRNASQLPNTINDASAVAALFRSVGFEVVNSRTDLGVVDFKRAVRDFLITAENADIAVVYYAGHGIEVGGTNYLIPVDAKLAREYDVEDEAVALDRIIWALQSVKRLRLILLDACRDNPFVAKLRSVTTRATPKGGLGKIDDVSADTLVGYAAKAGSVSYDGDGPNSPFASALLKHLAEPGLDVRIALGRVRDDVVKSTGGRQEPFFYGSLGGAIIPLVPLPPAKKIEPAAPPPVVATREPPARPAAAAAPVEPSPIEKPSPVTAKPVPPKVEPAKAPPPPASQAALEPEDPARACGRDEQRLARLRSNPVPDEIARFQTELSCGRLHAQVQRLWESVAAAPPASAPPAPVPTISAPPVSAPPAGRTDAARKPEPEVGVRPQAQAAPGAPDGACARDGERLARLRAEPTIEAIARFEKELGCEHIRPQLRRLRESLGQ
jgi:caspase domain-containing protein